MTILDDLALSRRQDINKINQYIESLGDNQDNFSTKRKTLSEILGFQNSMGIISELKPGSPSKGMLLDSIIKKDIGLMDETIENIEPIINAMIDAKVLGISVLTEPRRFFGSFGNLQAVSSITPETIPLLLKDFIIDESQMKLGKICGASNALLIASICNPIETAELMVKNGLEPLIEIHDELDLERIKTLKNVNFDFVIGINNRNLKDLSTSFNPTYDLVPKVRKIFGKDQIIITESGIHSRGDIIELNRLGVKAALVGTSIMQGFIKRKINELLGLNPPFVKICGITSNDTLKYINKPNISAFGTVIEVSTSPRNISVDNAVKLFNKSLNKMLRVIVTKDKEPKEIIDFDEKIKPDLIQAVFNDPTFQIKKLPSKIISKLLVPINGKKNGIKKSIEIIRSLPKEVFGVILDSSEGKGTSIDLEMAENIVESCPNHRIIIAGGINSKNAFNIYEKIRPFGLDISSGLESSPGIKDPEKIHNFIKEVDKIKKIIVK